MKGIGIYGIKEHHVRVSWDNYVVFLKPDEKDGIVMKDGIVVGDDGQVISTAYSKFINDAFWLCAPMDVKSKNIDLSFVDLNIDQDGLMAHYINGGDTPGDTYFYSILIKRDSQHVGKCGKPISCRWCRLPYFRLDTVVFRRLVTNEASIFDLRCCYF